MAFSADTKHAAYERACERCECFMGVVRGALRRPVRPIVDGRLARAPCPGPKRGRQPTNSTTVRRSATRAAERPSRCGRCARRARRSTGRGDTATTHSHAHRRTRNREDRSGAGRPAAPVSAPGLESFGDHPVSDDPGRAAGRHNPGSRRRATCRRRRTGRIRPRRRSRRRPTGRRPPPTGAAVPASAIRPRRVHPSRSPRSFPRGASPRVDARMGPRRADRGAQSTGRCRGSQANGLLAGKDEPVQEQGLEAARRLSQRSGSAATT